MVLKKRIMTAVTSAVFAASALCTTVQVSYFSDNNEEVSAAPVSSQTAQDIISQMTIGWNLGNSLESTNTSLSSTASPKKFVTSWGNPVPTEELIETVQEAGFNTIRIPVTWYQHLEYDEATSTYEINPEWLDYVKQTVDWAYSRDMFVILNVHHEDWVNAAQFTDESLKTAEDKLGDIWTQVSEEFKDYDQHLIFEGMNEPRQTGNTAVSEWGNGSEDNGYTWNYINTLNSVFIDAVRGNGSAENAERVLMIPSYCATSDTTALNALEIPENAGNVAISVHAYSPYFFTMDTSTYANHTFPGKSGYGEDYEQSLAGLFNNLKSVSASKNVPIIIGEFSASDFENTADRVNWAKSYLGYAEDAGIPCVLWDNNVSANGSGEAHGYIYRATNTIYPNSADVLKAMMDTVGVTEYTLPEYKEYTKPEFSWDTVGVGDDWIQLYYSENGTDLKSWGNTPVTDWSQYATENYQFVLVYDSESAGEIVLQDADTADSWNRISANEDLSKDYVAYFTYNDIADVLGATSATDVENLYISATFGAMKAYGLYAVPVSGSEIIDPPVVEKAVYGDVNCDGFINCLDFVLMKNYIFSNTELEGQVFINTDMNDDKAIDIRDALLLKKLLLNVA